MNGKNLQKDTFPAVFESDISLNGMAIEEVSQTTQWRYYLLFAKLCEPYVSGRLSFTRDLKGNSVATVDHRNTENYGVV